MSRGFTLVEIVLVLSVIGVFTSVAVPGIVRARDRAAVHGATSAVVSALADARHQALRWQRRTAIRFDTLSASVVVHAGTDTLERLALRAQFDVSLDATRDSVAFYPTGLGYGAANTRLIVSRGLAAETVSVSRAGRVRR